VAAFGPAIPVLRIFDEDMARAFYVDFLGFMVDFEHRVDDTSPIYFGLSCDGCALHLTGHADDAAPGAQIRVGVDDVAGFAELLRARQNARTRLPAPPDMLWDERELTVTDPFGNRLTFVQI
jgi:catechol 2,3-dioxygenase-like lactoylglutathione lyase family enzyme